MPTRTPARTTTTKRRRRNPNEARKLTVRAVPPQLYARLVKRADENQRSLEAEVVALFEEVLTPPDVDAMWAEWDEKTKDLVLTDDEIVEALREVRGGR